MIRYVTAEDLEPFGWICEACDRPLVVGAQVYGVPVGLTEDGDEIESDYRCAACWLAGAEVPA